MTATKKILSTRYLTEKPANSIDFEWHHRAFIQTNFLPFDQQTCIEWLKKEAEPAIAIFTSASSLDSLVAQGFPLKEIKKVCCISGATKKSVGKHLPEATILADGKNARLLLSHMEDLFTKNRFIFFCGAQRLNTIPEKLTETESLFLEMVVYETMEHAHVIKKPMDAVLFFSPSAVTSYLKSNRLKANTVAVSIGETTTKALKPYTQNIVEADFPSEQSMIETTINALQ